MCVGMKTKVVDLLLNIFSIDMMHTGIMIILYVGTSYSKSVPFPSMVSITLRFSRKINNNGHWTYKVMQY